MAKHTLKILQCSHCKIFKVCFAISQPYEINPRDIEILGWCQVESVLPHGEKVPL